MPPLLHLLISSAGQHCLDMTNAKALACAVDSGEEFACRFSDINTLGRIEAIIAIAAIVRWTFPEVTQQYGAAATARLHQSAKRSEEHTSELQSLMRISYAVFCLKKKNTAKQNQTQHIN